MIMKVTKDLEESIRRLSSDYKAYVENPDKDFTRARSLTFETMILTFLQMGGQTLSKELLNLGIPVSNSAFSQRRYLIKAAALEKLFYDFTDKLVFNPTYPILAVDGSDLHIPTIPEDSDSYFPMKQGQKDYNLLHLNTLFDIEHQIYSDAVIEKRRKSNERQALIDMMRRSHFNKALVIADRGYESYNVMAHFQECDWQYLIRIKEGATSITKSLDLPKTATYDLPITLQLTRRQTKETKAHHRDKELIKFLPSNQRFDFLSTTWNTDAPAEYYKLSFRIVRLELGENCYETLVTNSDYSVEELKNLYASRWGIETSFRELKYSLGLIHFHSKKMEGIYQEIFAHLIMFNYSKAITNQVAVPNRQRIYAYHISFTDMAYACRLFLCHKMSSTELEAYLQRHLTPRRPGRKMKRRTTVRHASGFTYRVA